ncbi:twin-arginine translocation signal domain-containing protein [Sulfolobus sp. S-194]|uniref:molybdopterin-dependent oxidoreductase n=1 Tax=Sulfolobus sp. S-194 TaxID=2512240 RepID=UPI001436FBEA|nr:molybdopterin-dependent oxidoreductase [Sulfolobus sp. S-194]QIW24037.1 twin-arginine translocation signal domain-containing protein [Sulfolobus sp. S-194]
MTQDYKSIRLTRRDFLKASALAAVGSGAAYAASKFNFNLLAPPVDYETPQPGWEYSYVPNVCAFCSSTCDILVRVEKKGTYIRAIEIDGNPLSPLNKGKICPRGRAGIFRTYNVDRIKTPLIRTGPKGTWSFREATWEEAINYIMQKFRELDIKPWEVILIGGGMPCANYKRYFIPFTLGTQMPNINGTPMQSCMFSLQQSVGYVIGGFDLHASDIMDDMTYSRLIVSWGTSAFSAGIFVNRGVRFGEGIANGAYVVVIDPRVGEAASKANLWIPIKPGTDLVLAMAIINYIIQNGYYDEYFVRYHTNAPFLAYEENGVVKLLEEDYEDGTVKAFYVYDEITRQIVKVPPFTNTNMYSVDGTEIRPALFAPDLEVNGKKIRTVFQFLADRVSSYTLEYASKVCDVPLSMLQEFAYRISTTKPMLIVTGLKGFWGDSSPQFRKATAMIMALTGNIDVRGGWVYSGKYREGMKEVIEVYNSSISSGSSKPGILLQRPEILAKVPLLDLPGNLLTIFAIIYTYNNPNFWSTGFPAVQYVYNQNLVQQGKKPAGAFTLYVDSGVYEAVKGQVVWNGQPYKIKAVMSYGGTPVNFQWDQYKEILKNTFYIDINIQPTEDTLYADVILPDVSYLERDEAFRYDGPAMDYTLRGRWQAIPVLYPNTANGLDLFVMFAYMLGKGDDYINAMANSVSIDKEVFKQIINEEMPKYQQYLIQNNGYPPWGSFTAKAWREAKLSFLSKKTGVPVEKMYEILRNNGVLIIRTVDEYFNNHERMPWDLPVATPTGRIELYSTVLYYYVVKNYGYDPVWDPLIAYVPPDWNYGYAREPGIYYPAEPPYNDPTFKPTPPEFFYVEYKIPIFAYTSSTNNPVLMAIASNSYHENIYQMAWINADVAKQMGINEGDWIVIERWKLPNPDGTIPKLVLRAHLTQLIRPDTIGVPEPYGQRNPALTYASKAVKNFGNKPISTFWPWSYNPLGGFRQSEQLTVKVRKATQDEIAEASVLAPVETSDTLPANTQVTPNLQISSSDWNSRFNISTSGGE